VPGACLLGSPPALAAATLAWNVFYLRQRHPGVISGKLSDLAINFLLPVVLVAVVEWSRALWSRGRARPLSIFGCMLVCAASATYFSLLKLVPAFTEVHAIVVHLLELALPGAHGAAHNVTDPSDLGTLVATPAAAWYLRGRQRSRMATLRPCDDDRLDPTRP
jgi:hypothetical protein